MSKGRAPTRAKWRVTVGDAHHAADIVAEVRRIALGIALEGHAQVGGGALAEAMREAWVMRARSAEAASAPPLQLVSRPAARPKKRREGPMSAGKTPLLTASPPGIFSTDSSCLRSSRNSSSGHGNSYRGKPNRPMVSFKLDLLRDPILLVDHVPARRIHVRCTHAS